MLHINCPLRKSRVLLKRSFVLSTRFWKIVALGGMEGGGVGVSEAAATPLV